MNRRCFIGRGGVVAAGMLAVDDRLMGAPGGIDEEDDQLLRHIYGYSQDVFMVGGSLTGRANGMPTQFTDLYVKVKDAEQLEAIHEGFTQFGEIHAEGNQLTFSWGKRFVRVTHLFPEAFAPWREDLSRGLVGDFSHSSMYLRSPNGGVDLQRFSKVPLELKAQRKGNEPGKHQCPA